MGRDKFKSIELFRSELDLGNEFEISYAGVGYDIQINLSKDKKELFWVSNLDNDHAVNYDTFDEMLDGFKAADGKTMREFILDALIDTAAVKVGELTEYANWKKNSQGEKPDR